MKLIFEINQIFDYEVLSNSWMTVDRLVTQIFFEEFNWDVHDAMDFNLEAWEKVKAVANGTVESAGTWTVTVLHNDWKKSAYHHIIPSEDILNGTVKTVTPETVLWVVAPDTAKYKAHLHLELKGENGKSLNPAKYFKIYNSQDSHKCMRELVIWEGIYDGEEVKEKCDIGIWAPKRCFVDEDCVNTPKNCIWEFGIVDNYSWVDYCWTSNFSRTENFTQNRNSFEVVNAKWNYLDFRFLWKTEHWYLEKGNMDEEIEFVSFIDVDNNKWSDYCEAIKKWKEKWWISGGSEELQYKNKMTRFPTWYFYPTINITREEALKIILRASVSDTSVFDDYDVTWKLNENTKKCLRDLPDLEWLQLWKYACYAYINWIIWWNWWQFLPYDDINYAETQKIIMNAFNFSEEDKIYNIPWRFDPEVWLKRWMLVYFMNMAVEKNKQLDISELWNCVLWSQELDKFVVTDSLWRLWKEWWKKKTISFVSDDWRKSDYIKNWVFLSDKAFDSKKKVFRDNFIRYAETENNCDKFVENMWLRMNEGNVWFFDEVNENNYIWHAWLYFIYKWQDYLLSFYPANWTDGIFLSSPEWVNGPWSYEERLKDVREELSWETPMSKNYIELWIDSLNISDLYKRYKYAMANLSGYNTFTNNCSDEVEKALDSAWFFKYTEIYGIPTPLPWTIALPWTTPIWLRFDILVELFYKNKFDF